MYKAEILADSLSPSGDRLTTMKITFPRIVLAEFNTHRMFSRNSASSRAIPFKKMIKMVEEKPFIPIAWQKDHKGMQGTEYFSDSSPDGFSSTRPATEILKERWLVARDFAVLSAKEIHKASSEDDKKVSKQLCNRLLEPFMWHTVIVSATHWDNFFQLRCPKYYGVYRSQKDLFAGRDVDKRKRNISDFLNESQADIHIQAIAELMWDAYNESTPKNLIEGDWHLPFSNNIDWGKLYPETQPDLDNVTALQVAHDKLIKISVARCARISYQTLGDNPVIDYEKDIDLFYKLKNSEHWSPFEHIAKATDTSDWDRNFKGFKQLRSILD